MAQSLNLNCPSTSYVVFAFFTPHYMDLSNASKAKAPKSPYMNIISSARHRNDDAAKRLEKNNTHIQSMGSVSCDLENLVSSS